MKKIFLNIILCAMAIVMVSCGGTKSDSEERESASQIRYHDSVAVACNNFDFAKAYLYAEKCDAKDEVIKKEGAYVLENQGESGLVRISMIINEHNAHWLYLDLMKIAIAMGDESLATKLYNMSDDCDVEAIDYAITADMEGLVNTFVSKKPYYADKQNVIEYLKKKGTYEKIVKSIRLAEFAKKKKEVLDQLNYLESRLPKMPKLGYQRADMWYGSVEENIEEYNKVSKSLNDYCFKMYSELKEKEHEFISTRDIAALCKIIKSRVKPRLELEDFDCYACYKRLHSRSNCGGSAYHYIKVSINNEDVIKARKML